MAHKYTIEIEVKDIYEAIKLAKGPSLEKSHNNMNAYRELDMSEPYVSGPWEDGIKYNNSTIRRYEDRN